MSRVNGSLRPCWVVPVVALLLFLGRAQAAEETVTASFTDRAGPNHYTVVFPEELGGQVIEMPITGGQFRMAFDADAESARLIEWRQDIAPITIAGASTGPITVTMDAAQPSSGAYDAGARTFTVGATFILEFDDSVLSQYGFVSPFRLQAAEQGAFYGTGSLLRAAMYLEGTGQFGLGEFQYTCKTSAEVLYDLPQGFGQPGDVNADHEFDIGDPIACLSHLYLGVEAPCPGAIEVNGDGREDLSDAVCLLGYLFLGGPEPLGDPVACK